MNLKQMAHYLVRFAIILIAFGILYKVLGVAQGTGFGVHDPGPLKVSPQAFLQMANTVLLLAIALMLLPIVEALSSLCGKEKALPGTDSKNQTRPSGE